MSNLIEIFQRAAKGWWYRLPNRNAEHRLGKFGWKIAFEPRRCSAFQSSKSTALLRNSRRRIISSFKIQSDVHRSRRMRERADGNEIHTGLGNRANGFQIHTAAGLGLCAAGNNFHRRT